MHFRIDFSTQPLWLLLVFDPSLVYKCIRVNVVYPQSVKALWGLRLRCPFDIFTSGAQHQLPEPRKRIITFFIDDFIGQSKE